MTQFKEWLRIRFIRPIVKYFRRREYFRRQQAIRIAKGELIENLEPLLLTIFSETVSDYRKSVQQTHYTIQACHDLRRLYEMRLKSYVVSKK